MTAGREQGELDRKASPAARVWAAVLTGSALCALALGCGGGAAPAARTVVTVTVPATQASSPDALPTGARAGGSASGPSTQPTGATQAKTSTSTATTPVTAAKSGSTTEPSARSLGSSTKAEPAPKPAPSDPAAPSGGQSVQVRMLLQQCTRRLRQAGKLPPKRRARLKALCAKVGVK